MDLVFILPTHCDPYMFSCFCAYYFQVHWVFRFEFHTVRSCPVLQDWSSCQIFNCRYKVYSYKLVNCWFCPSVMMQMSQSYPGIIVTALWLTKRTFIVLFPPSPPSPCPHLSSLFLSIPGHTLIPSRSQVSATAAPLLFQAGDYTYAPGFSTVARSLSHAGQLGQNVSLSALRQVHSGLKTVLTSVVDDSSGKLIIQQRNQYFTVRSAPTSLVH